MVKVELGDIIDKGMWGAHFDILAVDTQKSIGALSIIENSRDDVWVMFDGSKMKLDNFLWRPAMEKLLKVHGYELIDTEASRKRGEALRERASESLAECTDAFEDVKQALLEEMERLQE